MTATCLLHLVLQRLNDAPLSSITQGPDDEHTFLMTVDGGRRLTMRGGASLQLGAGPPQPVACAEDVERVLEGWSLCSNSSREVPVKTCFGPLSNARLCR